MREFDTYWQIVLRIEGFVSGNISPLMITLILASHSCSLSKE